MVFLSVAILFLLYAVRDTVDVPVACWVLTWAAAVISFLALEFKMWRRFNAGCDERTKSEGDRE